MLLIELVKDFVIVIAYIVGCPGVAQLGTARGSCTGHLTVGPANV